METTYTTKDLYEMGIIDARSVIGIALLEAGWSIEEQATLMEAVLTKTETPVRTYRQYTADENDGIREMYEAGEALNDIRMTFGLTKQQLIGRIAHLDLKRPAK
jgi:hypothetical protein